MSAIAKDKGIGQKAVTKQMMSEFKEAVVPRSDPARERDPPRS